MAEPPPPSTERVLPRAAALTTSMADTCGRAAVASLFLLQILTVLSEGVGLALIVPVVHSVTGEGSLRVPGLGFELSAVTALVAVVVVVALRAGLQWIAAIHGAAVRLTTTDALRLAALDALLHAEWRFLSTQRRSHLVQTLTTEVVRTGAALDLLTQLSAGVLLLVATATVAVALEPGVGAVAVIAVVLVGLAARRDIARASRLGMATSLRIQEFGAVVSDSLASARLVRAHEAAGRWVDLLTNEAQRGRQVQQRYVRASAGLRAILSVGAVIGLAGLILMARELDTDPARLVALVVIASRLLSTAQALVRQAQQFAHLAPAMDHVLAVTTDARAQRETAPPSGPTPHRPGDRTPASAPLLALRHVTVRYVAHGPPALDAVDLVIEAGAAVAVVGASGAGKSTLLDVVLGLLRPDEGTVEIDGQPLADLRAWRARLAYVPQDTVLIPGTVRENLTWSAAPGQRPTDVDVWEALQQAQLADAVSGMPRGLDTDLGEQTPLSGGERQRLAIARALVRRPELLVLDEATSALDTTTEAAVVAQLRLPARAILLVTHRPSLAEQADLVVRIDRGRLSETRSRPRTRP